jgi:HD-GYP domain-containing protein (c-di-GMP phosphodiesterase class II)
MSPEEIRVRLRLKLLLSIAVPILVVYVVMIVGVLTHLQGVASGNVQRRMTATAEHYADAFDGVLRELAQVARSNATTMETMTEASAAELFALLQASVDRQPLCYGAAIAFEPFAFDAQTRLFSPYVHRQDGALRSIDIAADAYDYTEPRWEWYSGPQATGGPVWTAPYFDEGAGGILMSTFSAPFFRDGQFAGVATVDVALEPLRRTVGAAFPGDLDLFVVTSTGQYVFHPDPDRIMTTGLGEDPGAGDPEDVARLAEAMTALGTGFAPVMRQGEETWVFHAPVPAPRWSLGLVVTRRDALAAVTTQVIWLSTVLGGTLALIGLLIWLASGHVARPLTRLTDVVREVAGGDLDAEARGAERADEVGDLARSFNSMRTDIKTLMAEQVAEQERRRDAIIFSLARLAEERDNETGQHLERICSYVEIIATELAKERDDIDEHWVRTISVTAALHDIGKVGVPDAVLQKPGKLTDEERVIIQKHTTIGGDTLMEIKRRWEDDTFLVTATEIAFAHHERWDGKGYPFGLEGEIIGLAARIVSVADVYDALTSVRVYKPGMSHEDACRIIIEGAGTQFDPGVVAVFERVAPRIEEVARELHDEPGS